jgi:hypothetical protein
MGGGHATGWGWGRRGGPVAWSDGGARSCMRQGRPGADERAPATVLGGLNLIQSQIQIDSNHLNF